MIITGDAVRLDLRPARVPSRAAATSLDLLWQGGLLLLWWLVVDYWLDVSPAGQNAAFIGGNIVILTVVWVAVELLSGGRSPGRWATGLRVVRDDGGAVRLRHVVIRRLAFWFVDFSPLTLGVLGVLVAAIHPEGRRVGDLLAGTVVVRTRSPRQPPLPPEPDPELAEWMSRLQLSGLGDDVLAAARNVVRRGRELRPGVRQQLMDDLAQQVFARLTPDPPRPLSSEELLVAVVAERRRRARERAVPASTVPTVEQLPAGWR